MNTPSQSSNRSELQAWFGTTGDWDTAILPELEATLAHVKEKTGAEAVGVAGFCWGGKMAMKAASLGVDGGVKAAGCVHPSMLSPELADDVSYGVDLETRPNIGFKPSTNVCIFCGSRRLVSRLPICREVTPKSYRAYFEEKMFYECVSRDVQTSFLFD